MSESFFEKPFEQSKTKGLIVAEYFAAWAKIMVKCAKDNIAYIDLFSGPGRYEDGSESTPLLILKTAIGDKKIGQRLKSLFADQRADYVRSLQHEINSLDGIKSLKHEPRVWQEQVGENIVRLFKGMKLIPSLVFLDPCGYKGLSLDLVNSVLKDWGCECIFFFNYNRINPGIHNDSVDGHINSIFGIDRANALRMALQGLGPQKREQLILRHLLEALKATHGQYVQHFRVRQRDKDRTSHYLIFVTKNFTGYEIMRDIMGKHSSVQVQGVPSFEYNKFQTCELFHKPLDELKGILLTEFAGQTMTMKQIYELHSPGRNCIKRNYKDALMQLDAEDRIKVTSPPGSTRRKGTFSDRLIVTFPAR